MMNAPCAVWDTRMTDRRVLLQPAYVLHQRAYRDTSALVELFSPEHGRVGVVAKGVRGKKSRWRGILQVFQPLLVSWTLRGELGTLTAAESQGPALMQAPEFIASGFYLNEILMRLLTRHDPHAELFGAYDSVLRDVAAIESGDAEANIQLESLLRKFELQMLTSLGYGLVLDHDVESGAPVCLKQEYSYLFERGPVALTSAGVVREAVASISGETLLALQAGDLSGQRTRREAKHLLRAILGQYLGSKPLFSRQLMRPAVPTPPLTSFDGGEEIHNASS